MPEKEIDQSKSSFPARFSKMLFERYPDWEKYVIKPNLKWQSKDDLALEVPSRFTPLCPLRIETMDDGIIINWVGYHVHCDNWGDTYTEEEFIEEAFDIIGGLISEKLVVMIILKQNSMGSGGLYHANQIDQEMKEGLMVKWAINDTLLAISWNGTYDRGEFDPSKCIQPS